MFNQALFDLLWEGTVDTLYMTLASTFFSYVFGMVMAVVLVLTRADGIKPHPVIFRILDVVVNLTRSFPFLILMIAVIPFTRWLVGTTIGNNATIVPLVIAAAPFVARLIEQSLLEVDRGVVEAAQSMGASTWQLVWKVLIPEAMPSLINGSAIAATTILGYSAMSGAVGGGGLGKLAIMYGYNRYQDDIMFATVVLLIVIVQLLQSFGDWATRRSDKRSTK
ncbi:MAG: ABC transporter permease [Desulfovibrio sp.]|jgi:D-methionine transport system permease protein|nr:ABC transporter permease [Desulfovibrio sp.]MBR4746429.1 ABC transporter permease [Desulfovibrio sp.]MBR5050771.1 ABC transporter permease [Desulfovibrio sp.]MBR6467581.1 ABC transporter permease [Desulfovibrio sp.]MCR5170013.1 ABC transporter permease [Desulfovibrio sp.]